MTVFQSNSLFLSSPTFYSFAEIFNHSTEKLLSRVKMSSFHLIKTTAYECVRECVGGWVPAGQWGAAQGGFCSPPPSWATPGMPSAARQRRGCAVDRVQEESFHHDRKHLFIFKSNPSLLQRRDSGLRLAYHFIKRLWHGTLRGDTALQWRYKSWSIIIAAFLLPSPSHPDPPARQFVWLIGFRLLSFWSDWVLILLRERWQRCAECWWMSKGEIPMRQGREAKLICA